VNFNLRGRDRADNTTVIPGRNHVLKNLLGFAGGEEVAELDAASSDVSGNSFTLPIAIAAADFLSLDESELMRPRKANGDLPDIDFLRLAPGSAAIDRGVDVGRPFAGSAPDLGAFEAEAPGK
jgi:pectate lyase